MSSPLRILLIAYAVPPSVEVGGVRIHRFCKYLPECGIEPVVLTVQHRFYKQLDHTFSFPPEIRVVTTEQHGTPLDWYANWKGRRSSTHASEPRKDDERLSLKSRTRYLRQHLLSAASFPDQYWGWYSPAARAGRALLENAKFDAILSTAPPCTAHLIARSLKKKYKIPWIADFRDPWVTDQLACYSEPTWRRKLDMQMEAGCVRSADLVVCNTAWQRDIMCCRYKSLPVEKFVILTNGFDDVEAPLNQEVKKREPLLCLHLGGIYEGRRIDTFCAGLSILVKKKRLDPKAVRVLFVGYTDESQVRACRQVASELMDSGMIQFHERVDKKEAQRFLWESDLLLVFQGRYRAQVPLKFYEYLSTGKPILAVGQSGALSDLMVYTGGMWADENDPSEIGQKFLVALTLPTLPPRGYSGTLENAIPFPLFNPSAGRVDSEAGLTRNCVFDVFDGARQIRVGSCSSLQEKA